MATTKPRITISLTPEQYKALKRLADLQSRPMATALTDLVGELLPIMIQLADIIEISQKAEKTAREQMSRPLQQLLQELEPLRSDAFARLGKIAKGDFGEG